MQLPGLRALLALGSIIWCEYFEIWVVWERSALKHLKWELGKLVSLEKGSCFL